MQGTANEVKVHLGKLQSPPLPHQGDWDDIKATCFQSSYKDQGKVLYTPFTLVFDVKTKFTDDKSQMHACQSSTLKTGDIVLVEAWICRYASRNQG
ncbi:hypothetical protein PAXINDRAFT_19968 [Paxillus involutus ATCC 200175]|uniref:Uncharacterized protein n=1 Tax=Paxillus involutus ATCC 200175 TaxID=664439 RepID=A0A0C9T6A0_PAXIN|nr:hypothetical protein PAXINDRAFT_19968 [Paxillus involutus ATCC 200175]